MNDFIVYFLDILSILCTFALQYETFRTKQHIPRKTAKATYESDNINDIFPAVRHRNNMDGTVCLEAENYKTESILCLHRMVHHILWKRSYIHLS